MHTDKLTPVGAPTSSCFIFASISGFWWSRVVYKGKFDPESVWLTPTTTDCSFSKVDKIMMHSSAALYWSSICIICTPNNRYAVSHQIKLIPDHLSPPFPEEPIRRKLEATLICFWKLTHTHVRATIHPVTVYLHFNWQMLNVRIHLALHLPEWSR